MLVDQLPGAFSNFGAAFMANFVTIALFNSQPKAEGARLHLAHHGIRSVLQDENIVAMDWFLSNAVGGIKLQVVEDDVADATNLLQQIEAEQLERRAQQATEFIRFNCTECGVALKFTADRRGGIETCTQCGCFVDVPEATDEQLVDQHLTLDAIQTTRDEPTTTAGTESDAFMELSRSQPSLKWEVVGALCIFYVPLVIGLPSFQGDPPLPSFAAEMQGMIVGVFQVVPAVLLLIALRGEPWAKFGIAKPRWVFDPCVALGLWLVATFADVLAMQIFPLETSVVKTVPEGWGMLMLCAAGLLANSITEELTMRGYLIPRFEELFGSTFVAVVVSSLLFASYHLHYGISSSFVILVMGVVYGVMFCIVRRVWPLVIAHTITNL